MANQGSVCVYFYNDNINKIFYREEKTRIISRQLVQNNTNNFISVVDKGYLNGANSTIQKIIGNVKVNGNPVIREVVAFNKYHQPLGRTLSSITDGSFSIPIGSFSEEVYCLAIDPKFSCYVSCGASDTTLTLLLSTSSYSKIIGASYPKSLPENFLNNSVIKIDDEQIFINSVSKVINNNIYGSPISISCTVTRGYNSTSAVAHSLSQITANCNIVNYNNIVYSHQIGV